MPTKTWTTATQMVPKMLEVLSAVEKGTNRRGRAFLTAYRILTKLDRSEAESLINERGGVGRDAGKPYGACGLLARAGRMLEKRGKVEIAMLDARGLQIEVRVQGEKPVKASDQTLGLYRFK